MEVAVEVNCHGQEKPQRLREVKGGIQKISTNQSRWKFPVVWSSLLLWWFSKSIIWSLGEWATIKPKKKKLILFWFSIYFSLFSIFRRSWIFLSIPAPTPTAATDILLFATLPLSPCLYELHSFPPSVPPRQTFFHTRVGILIGIHPSSVNNMQVEA